MTNYESFQTSEHTSLGELSNQSSDFKDNIKRMTVDSAIRERIIDLYNTGHNPGYISNLMNKKRTTVSSIIRKFISTGEIFASSRGGDRRSKLNQEHKNTIRSWIDKDCLMTLKEISERFIATYNFSISMSSINRCPKNFHYTLKMQT